MGTDKASFRSIGKRFADDGLWVPVVGNNVDLTGG